MKMVQESDTETCLAGAVRRLGKRISQCATYFTYAHFTYNDRHKSYIKAQR